MDEFSSKTVSEISQKFANKGYQGNYQVAWLTGYEFLEQKWKFQIQLELWEISCWQIFVLEYICGALP